MSPTEKNLMLQNSWCLAFQLNLLVPGRHLCQFKLFGPKWLVTKVLYFSWIRFEEETISSSISSMISAQSSKSEDIHPWCIVYYDLVSILCIHLIYEQHFRPRNLRSPNSSSPFFLSQYDERMMLKHINNYVCEYFFQIGMQPSYVNRREIVCLSLSIWCMTGVQWRWNMRHLPLRKCSVWPRPEAPSCMVPRHWETVILLDLVDSYTYMIASKNSENSVVQMYYQSAIDGSRK